MAAARREKPLQRTRPARPQGRPESVTLRGERAAVVLSAEAFDALTAARPSLVDHLLSGPLWPDDVADAVNARAKTPSRAPEF